MKYLKYKLKTPVWWYKAGEMFWYDSEGTLWHDDGINKPIKTLDRLQNAMASYFEDEGMEEYVELVNE